MNNFEIKLLLEHRAGKGGKNASSNSITSMAYKPSAFCSAANLSWAKISSISPANDQICINISPNSERREKEDITHMGRQSKHP